MIISSQLLNTSVGLLSPQKSKALNTMPSTFFTNNSTYHLVHQAKLHVQRIGCNTPVDAHKSRFTLPAHALFMLKYKLGTSRIFILALYIHISIFTTV